MSNEVSSEILLIGIESEVAALIRGRASGMGVTELREAEQFFAAYEHWRDGQFMAIFCGPTLESVNALEIAQVLNIQCRMTPKFFVSDAASGATQPTAEQIKTLSKNGFTKSFFLPTDEAALAKTIVESTGVLADGDRQYEAVSLFDVNVGARLEFDAYVHLPLNNKYVRFFGAGETLPPSKVTKLVSQLQYQVFIETRDLPKFYRYSASHLWDLAVSATGSPEEKQEKLKEAVRRLFTDLFDPEAVSYDQIGRKLKQCQSIISNFITKGGSHDWYKNLMAAVGESGDGYSHASSVSTFAALFAIALGVENIEDVALAGLLHDIAFGAVPEEVRRTPENQRSPAQSVVYYRHVDEAVKIARAKRILINPEVENAILQHHERWDGKGFPKSLVGPMISRSAQIIAFADQFDYMTRFQPGRKRLTPMEAWVEISMSDSIDPAIVSAIGHLLRRESYRAKAI